MRRFIALFLTVLPLLLSSAQAAGASLREAIKPLEVLPVSYGVTEVWLNTLPALIVRGRFENGNAWDGDVYTLLQKGPNNWRMVRHDSSPRSSVLTTTMPHTEEDSIDSVRFMVPKGEAASKRLTSLYLLRATRAYEPDKGDTKAVFSLFLVKEDQEFGILRFHSLAQASSKAAYCNVDWAMDRELGIPLRAEENEMPCGGPDAP